MGSIQYAGSHLHTPLFVVLGHEGCGAVKAAIESKLNGAKHHSRIQILVNNILMETLEGQQAAREGRKKLVGAIYEINSGRVRFL
jgi:carbonic anhydrase